MGELSNLGGAIWVGLRTARVAGEGRGNNGLMKMPEDDDAAREE